MKTKSRFFTVVLSALSFIFCNAQQTHHIHHTGEELTAEHKKQISNSGYIFEGTVIKQSLKKGTVLTCNVIQITKIYKGSPVIKIGTIKVLTEQSPNTKDGWKGLSKGSTYLIFGNLGDTSSFKTITVDNILTISFVDCIYFLSGNTARWDGALYSTLDSLYSFLQGNGLSMEVEAESQKSSTPADSTKH